LALTQEKPAVIPDAGGLYSSLPLYHVRYLRGRSLGLCFSPIDELGDHILGVGIDAHAGSFPESDWCAITGRSGCLVALEFAEPPQNLPPLPPTWEVIRPGIRQRWFKPPELAEAELLPMTNIWRNVRVLRLAPLPGNIHRQSGDRYEWHPDLNPWSLAKPATLPIEWWRALPKKTSQQFRYSRKHA
jgi:hypothetical protein